MHTKSSAFLILLLISLCTVTAWGQVDVASATLKGIITDPNDAVIAGASVTATNTEKGISRTTTTNAEGAYHIPVLPPAPTGLKSKSKGLSEPSTRACRSLWARVSSTMCSCRLAV